MPDTRRTSDPDFDDLHRFGRCRCGAVRRGHAEKREGMTILVLRCDKGHTDA